MQIPDSDGRRSLSQYHRQCLCLCVWCGRQSERWAESHRKAPQHAIKCATAKGRIGSRWTEKTGRQTVTTAPVITMRYNGALLLSFYIFFVFSFLLAASSLVYRSPRRWILCAPWMNSVFCILFIYSFVSIISWVCMYVCVGNIWAQFARQPTRAGIQFFRLVHPIGIGEEKTKEKKEENVSGEQQ